MLEVPIRDFTISPYKWFNDLPLVITKRGKPVYKLEKYNVATNVPTKQNVPTNNVPTSPNVPTNVPTKDAPKNRSKENVARHSFR